MAFLAARRTTAGKPTPGAYLQPHPGRSAPLPRCGPFLLRGLWAPQGCGMAGFAGGVEPDLLDPQSVIGRGSWCETQLAEADMSIGDGVDGVADMGDPVGALVPEGQGDGHGDHATRIGE